MANLQGWRKAYEALKDSTGLADSEYKDLDVAIVKATDQAENPPDEQHIRDILAEITSDQPRADVAYCVHALGRRLIKTNSWVVAVKTLIVIHKILREGDPKFRDELMHCSLESHILQINDFNDDSSYLAMDCSEWVRLYATFLEERLECFRVLKYDIEGEHLQKSSEGSPNEGLNTRALDSRELLEKLPALQKFLFSLICCQPEGEATNNYLIKYALSMVVRESFKIYCVINDGIINLVDLFFQMPKEDALIALDIYKRAIQQALNLAEFYEVCKGLELARNFQFPVTKAPPRTLVPTMEEYIKEVPQANTISDTTIESTAIVNAPIVSTPFIESTIPENKVTVVDEEPPQNTVDMKPQMLTLQDLEERINRFQKKVMLNFRVLIVLCILILIFTVLF